MASLRMRALAIYLRLMKQPTLANRARFRERMAAPKVYAEPPRKLRERHDMRLEKVGGFNCWTASPPVSKPKWAVLYLHGGAYISPITAHHWTLIGQLVNSGCRVDVPLYGLTPQHTVDEAIPFVLRAYQRLLEDHDPASVALAGDSAGGGLTLAAAQEIREKRLASPALPVLIAPWLDVTLSNPNVDAVDDPWHATAGLREAGRAWAGQRDPRDRFCSPKFGSLERLPLIELFIRTRDLFHPDVVSFAAACADAGTSATLHEVEGAVHVYPLTPTPGGQRARPEIIAALDTHM